MDLPQTAPGVPASNVDPTIDELASMQDIAAIFDWLGTAEPVRASFIGAMGGGAPRLRDIVYMTEAAWSAAVGAITVAVPDNPERALSPIERGHLPMVRRIARLRLGLTAVEEQTGAPPGGAGGAGAQAVSTGALPGGAGLRTPASAAMAETSIKLSMVLDPSVDSVLVRLAPPVIRDLFTAYQTKRGAEPSEEVEPTTEQISA